MILTELTSDMTSNKHNSIKIPLQVNSECFFFSVFILKIILNSSYAEKVTCGLFFLYGYKNDVYSCCDLQIGKP